MSAESDPIIIYPNAKRLRNLAAMGLVFIGLVVLRAQLPIFWCPFGHLLMTALFS